MLNQKFSNYSTFSARISTKKYQKALEDFKKKSIDKSAAPAVEEGSENVLEAPEEAFKKKTQLPTTLESTSICLFTNVLFESFEKNLEQMAKKFGFIVYEEKSCVKKQDLIKYLAKLIHKENRCIYCDQRFKNGSDVQKHMVSKMHCLMNPEYFGQYEKFYDFSEENRRVALELQERFKHVKSDNQFVYMIKNKSEEAKREKKTEEIRENGSADGSEEDDWEDDEVAEEDAEKSRAESRSGQLRGEVQHQESQAARDRRAAAAEWQDRRPPRLPVLLQAALPLQRRLREAQDAHGGQRAHEESREDGAVARAAHSCDGWREPAEHAELPVLPEQPAQEGGQVF